MITIRPGAKPDKAVADLTDKLRVTQVGDTDHSVTVATVVNATKADSEVKKVLNSVNRTNQSPALVTDKLIATRTTQNDTNLTIQEVVDLTTLEISAPTTAAELPIDITNFNGILSATDTDVQKALDIIDDHTHLDQDASTVSVDTINFDKVLGVADDTIQKALDTLDERSSYARDTATDSINFAGNLSAADIDVQKALETLDAIPDAALLDQTVQQAIVNGQLIFSDGIQLGALPNIGSHVEGKLYYDAVYKSPAIMVSDNVILHIGHDQATLAYNNTGANLASGSLVVGVGILNGALSVQQATSTIHDRIDGVLAHDIPHLGTGILVRDGDVLNVDTSTYSVFDTLYLSATTPGAFDIIPPVDPSHYVVPIGVVKDANVSGIVSIKHNSPSILGGLADVRINTPTDKESLTWNGSSWVNSKVDTALSSWNGTFAESFNATISSDGITVTMSLQSKTLSDLTMQFSTGKFILDCTPAQTVTLTPGSLVSPQSNYVYINFTTKLPEVSTTGWPTAEHIKIAYFFIQTATQVQTKGALVSQNWNDELVDTSSMGHITHIGQWIRGAGAQWFSGCDSGGTSGYLSPHISGATIQINSGVISQMHKQLYSAKDTSAGDVAHVVNYFNEPYKEIVDINQILLDASGAALTGRYYNIVIMGVANKGGEYSPVLIKIASGSYNTANKAAKDNSHYDDYTIPREFNKESSVGFLIARITIHNQADTTYTVTDTHDLRGTTPATAGGGAGGSLTEFADNQFLIYNNIDSSKKIEVDVSGISTGIVRKLSAQDTDGLIALSTSGITANRPTTSLIVGRFYFDTTLGIPIWYSGVNWVDATGTIA